MYMIWALQSISQPGDTIEQEFGLHVGASWEIPIFCVKLKDKIS